MCATLVELLRMRGYDTDKSEGYLNHYEPLFRPLQDKEVKLLELGVGTGGSLFLWRDYFLRGLIAGLDVKRAEVVDQSGRIRIFQGLQQDVALLAKIAHEIAPQGFDIIVDDASHIAQFTQISFWYLFQHHLKPGGIYAIEDWGTGYWASWPDGRQFDFSEGKVDRSGTTLRADTPPNEKQEYPNHVFGMVGFIKTLVDECGRGDITKPGLGTAPYQASKFEKMHVSHGQVIVIKWQPVLKENHGSI